MQGQETDPKDSHDFLQSHNLQRMIKFTTYNYNILTTDFNTLGKLFIYQYIYYIYFCVWK